ncbi:MAG: aminotransferase class V-fold PLP-dependent enzyme, partial [Clostridia bacterium]|nr:aminotransferase class V-fold PLP-dependent enzyme [Clostridia bacterium]
TSFIVDASQGAGIIPLDMQKIGADAMCMPGHKGLMGPVGTGVMILGRRKPRPFLFGGTGIASEEAGQPETSPERYESGTLNICGISGLAAALEYIGRNWDHLHGRKRQLCEIISDIIGAGGMRVFGPEKNFESGIFSFDPGFDSEIAAGMLGSRGIAVRGGLHCSPLAHRSAGTAERGTVRISPQSNLSFRCARKTAEHIVKVLAMTGQ